MVRFISVLTVVLSIFLVTNVFAQVPSDVPRNHWAYDAVELLIKEGVMKGYPDGTFRGNQNLTRYELVVIVAKLLEMIKNLGMNEQEQVTSREQVKTQQTVQPEATKLSFKRREIPSDAYTGLVIDARGKKISRSISPKIYDKKGREIYGVSIFNKEQHSIEEYVLLGIVEYIRYEGLDLDKAIKNSRAGSRSLIIKAVGTHGEFGDDIIVSEEDGNIIFRENETSKFLEDMAVVIIY